MTKFTRDQAIEYLISKGLRPVYKFGVLSHFTKRKRDKLGLKIQSLITYLGVTCKEEGYSDRY